MVNRESLNISAEVLFVDRLAVSITYLGHRLPRAIHAKVTDAIRFGVRSHNDLRPRRIVEEN